jgi:putative Mn2+ efflux pump MntP
MDIWSSVIIGISLAMDAAAVSLCKGLAVGKAKLHHCLLAGAYFGIFQGAMPAIGYALGRTFADFINAFDHWVAFVLLALIGANMLKEALGKEECDCCDTNEADLSPKTMFVMAVATSIDALAVGISLAMAGDVNIVAAVLLIGITTFLLSGVGVKVGNVFGSRFEKKAQLLGGVILILLGTKILLEHLGILA